ncbi:MAG: hypothetical protein LUP91_10065, partial [Methylococcaceae bacterium]|nr:hypothetical protein [Methylococcaceae bacterium]
MLTKPSAHSKDSYDAGRSAPLTRSLSCTSPQSLDLFTATVETPGRAEIIQRRRSAQVKGFLPLQ